MGIKSNISQPDKKSTATAAELTGLSIFEFKETLKARGIKIIIDTPSSEDINRQIKHMERAR